MSERGNNAGAERIGIGARLQAARERANLSLVQAATKMHVDPTVIHALESEQFSQLGAAVYVRGHLRHYAELVKESAPQLLDLYAASINAGARPDLTQMPHAPNNSSVRSALVTTGVALVIGVGLIGSVRWIYQDLHPAGGEAAPSVAVHSPPAALPEAPASVPAPVTAEPAQAVPVPAPAVTVAAASAPKPVAAKRPRAAVADASVTLKFKSDCWTEVFDARGTALYRAIGAEGAEAHLHGPGPLKVVVGNFAAVDVEINDQVQAIPQEAQSGHRAQFLVTHDGELQPVGTPAQPTPEHSVTTAGNKP